MSSKTKSSKIAKIPVPDNVPRHERLLLVLICAVALARIFIFNAAFPLFCNVDEQMHFDYVWRCAHGRLIAGLEHFDPEALKVIIPHETHEYLSSQSEAKACIPSWLLSPRESADILAFVLPERELKPNTEGMQPPLYYMLAGAWYALGNVFHFSPFWVRFLNVFVFVVTVWFSYVFAKNLYPERAFLRLGLPLTIALVPQDLFYSISNNVLFALLYGASFYCLVLICQGKRERLGFYVLAGALCAASVLAGYTNVAVYSLLAVTLVLRIVAARRDRILALEARRLAALVTAAVIPVAAWMIRNYIVIGAPTAGGQFEQFAHWYVKPFAQMGHHPIFTANGFGVFWTELMTTYFRGEFVWYGERLAVGWADAFYVWSPVVFLLSAVALLAWSKRKRPERFVDGMGLLAILSSIAILVGLSIRYDFGHWWAPSDSHPYYSHGRLMYGTMLPFFALYLSGLDMLLARIKLQKYRYVALAAICALMLVSEILISTDVFKSQFNWFHMIASIRHSSQ